MRECQTSLTNCEQAITRHRRQSRDLKVEVNRLDDDVARLQEAIDRDSLEEGKLDELKKQLSGAKQNVDTQQAQFGDSVLAVDRARDALKPLRDQMKAIDVELAEVQAKIGKAEKRQVDRSLQREAALRDKNFAFSEIDRAKASQVAAQKRRVDHEETVRIYSGKAGEICPRVPIDRGETCGSLEKKLEKLQADLNRAETRFVL